MLIFLLHLVKLLDVERPGWKDDTVCLLDGARYHMGARIREHMRKLELQVIYSAPYSFSTAPIEMVFGALKTGELNPDGHKTGKKVSARSLFSIDNSAGSSLNRRYGGRQAREDTQGHLRKILARDHPQPVQVSVLSARLRPPISLSPPRRGS